MDQEVLPRDIAGPIGLVDPLDVVLTSWTRGYRLFEGSERQIAHHTNEKHHERVVLWYRLLTLFHAAFAGLAGPVEDDHQELDELDPLARDLRLRLLAMAGGTTKLALDAAMAGYYSQCFGLIRHMIESWFQLAFVRHFPNEAERWYERRGGPAEQLYELPYHQVRRRIRQRSDEDDRELIDVIDQVYQEMHKCAHPSSVLLGLTVGAEERTYVVGANYNDILVTKTLNRGITATYWLLGEMQLTEPTSESWKLEYWSIFQVHRAMLADQVDEQDDANETEPDN